MKRLLGSLTLSLVLSACGSPEATRTRGGGPGGDTGNRPERVRMHEGSRPYYEVPRLLRVETSPLDGAQQARELARP